VQIGRAEGYFSQQFYVNMNPMTVPLFFFGLYYYFFAPDGAQYRAIGWIYVMTLALFGVSQGRFYYMAPAYPMILAGGAVQGERWLAGLTPKRQQLASRLTVGFLMLGAIIGVALTLPVAPINSALWDVTGNIHDNFVEQIGWEEMAQTVGEIYEREAGERPSLGIFVGNYGEAGALNLYGPSYGLPPVISPVNSNWDRGYGQNPPESVIALGFSKDFLDTLFQSCRIIGKNENDYGVDNEESRFSPDIFLCEDLRESWAKMWPQIRSFG
jgi:hypothetical protein